MGCLRIGNMTDIDLPEDELLALPGAWPIFLFEYSFCLFESTSIKKQGASLDISSNIIGIVEELEK